MAISEPTGAAAAYELVQDTAALQRWIAEAADRGVVAFDTATTGLDCMRADLVGVSLALDHGRACSILLPPPRPAAPPGDTLGPVAPAATAQEQLPVDGPSGLHTGRLGA